MIVCFVTTIYRDLPYFTCLAPQVCVCEWFNRLASELPVWRFVMSGQRPSRRKTHLDTECPRCEL